MIFARAINGPRASIETRTLSTEELGQFLKDLFLSGEDMETGQGTAERLSPVAAAHRILSNSFGLIPFDTYTKDGDARKAVHDPALDRLLKVRPNERMSPYLCQKLIMSNAFWHGFGACWNRRDGDGRLVARIPLPTECCTIRKDRESGHYWYDYNVDGWQRTFAPYELSLLFFETYNGARGRGLLALARETIALDAMAQRYERKFYQNGARLSGVLEVDTDANPATRQKLKDEFRGYASDDAFAVAVVDHGMKFTSLGLSQSDAQYIESRAFTVEEIARFTGIPKHMLQTGKESYDSNAQQRQNYVTDTLLPYVVQWEQEDGYKAIPPDKRDGEGWYMRGNVAVLLRGDDLTRSQFYERMVRNTIYNPDECRALEEKPPIPGGLGQEFLVSKNLASLGAVLKGEK